MNIVIENKKEKYYLNCNNIISLEANGRYTEIVLEYDKRVFCKNLAEFEKILPACFLRIHHSHIVNYHNIKFRLNDIIIMKNNEKFKISRRKKNEIDKKMEKLIQNSNFN